jgi:ADP-ribose pyrophosphatase
MERVYEGRVFAVDVGRRRFPNGAEHDVAIVRHRPSVVILPVLDDGRVILVRQYRPSIERMTWELPAGSIDPGESIERAAIRECAEETRMVPGRVERLAGLYPAPGFCDELLVFFLASSLTSAGSDSPFQADEDEDIETRAVTVDEGRAMVARGEIEDLKTAYGLSLAR